MREYVRIGQASDAFFGRGGKLMAMSQIEQALKFELLLPVRSAAEPIHGIELARWPSSVRKALAI
jgi:hypothetical protein